MKVFGRQLSKFTSAFFLLVSFTLAWMPFCTLSAKLIVTTNVILQVRNRFISFKFSSHSIVLQMKVYGFSGSSFWNQENFCLLQEHNKEFCVLHVQSNTTIIHLLVQQEYNYMFRPHMCAIFRLRLLTYRLVIQDMWGVWVGGGNEISLFQ